MKLPERHTHRFESGAGTNNNKMENTPYQYYNNQLGVKIKYLTTDRCHIDSLRLLSSRALNKRMNSETRLEKRLRRSSLSADALIKYNSISREWKDLLTLKFGSPKKEIKKSWFAEHYELDLEAKEFFLAFRYGNNNEKKLNLNLVDKYTYEASVLNTVLKIKVNRKAYAKALGVTSLDIWQSLSNDVNSFREVPHNLPPNKDSLRRRVKAYQKKKYYSFLGKIGNKNSGKVISKEQLVVLDQLLKFHNGIDDVQIATFYNEIARNIGWKEITEGTVANRRKKKHLSVHASRKGVKSLQNKLLMQHKRKRPSTPMLYWTMDGWDVELMYQETTINKKGHKVTTYHNRPTVVIIIDPFNNYPVGYAIGTQESPTLIKKALQNAMQHVKELFGEYYRPYQLQSDNYQKKVLKPLYNAVAKIYTPARVGNAKSKVIEPYFSTINKKYCKLLRNWSGYGVASGSDNQPNVEYLNKTKKNFPTKQECFNQIEAIINTERAKKVATYTNKWLETKSDYKSIMSAESYLLALGDTTGHSNKLRGEGLVITIEGKKHYYDSFDINFRHQATKNWIIKYDATDLTQVLAVSTCGSERFLLEPKYIEPMAIADREDGDMDRYSKIEKYNEQIKNEIIQEHIEDAKVLDPFLQGSTIQNTMAKLLLTDSLGQHKNHKSSARIQASKQAAVISVKHTKKQEETEQKTFAQQQDEYYKTIVNIEEFL